MTQGTATARVLCKNVDSGPCSVQWVGQSACEARLYGTFEFPLRCAASTNGTAITPGAKFYAGCGIDGV